MHKNWIRYLIVFLVMSVSQQAISKEIKNSVWCFTLSDASTGLLSKDIIDFNVKYQDRKTGKWKSVAKSLCGWGFQPDFSFERCYQFYAPSNISAFEITIFQKQQTSKILIDQLPDTLSKYKLIGFNHLLISGRSNQNTFKNIEQVKLGSQVNPEIYPMDVFFTHARIETSQQRFEKNSPIKIYIESNDSLQLIVLSGCGTPGTLYILQQWENGAWIDYQNMWGVKCVHQKYKVIRYIVGLTIDHSGIYRVVFDERTENSTLFPLLASNPFEIK